MSSIILEQVNLNYRVFTERRIKDIFFKPQGSQLIAQQSIHALKDISIQLSEGDKLGIIGHNGAGKSSLLKTIAKIYPITSGGLEVKGRVATLFELATGFEMEATGWENILLRGLMLGESPQSMKQKKDEIAEFSELGDYLNIPVKYYSSGMFMRLAFSVSTAIEPDILLLDEVIAAGDAKFINKANKRINDLMNKIKILVFVTHSMSSLKQFCNKCIWLEKGQIKMIGSPEEVSQLYIESSQE
ncbi:ABC transporter ATP-binding protein [Paenibacillus sp. GCM10027627]|uniref:ABC transporter ATP-binding protein n=1 Tax=unclassified Paenibacillus TaxID=185978 RepID=UPI00363D349B